MRSILLLLSVLLLGSAAPAGAGAYSDRSVAAKVPTWDRSVIVYARYLAPSACYRIAERRMEPAVPYHGNMPPTTVEYTLVVEKTGGACPRAATLLQETFVSYANAYDWAVRVTFVDSRGRVLKSERLAVPGQ